MLIALIEAVTCAPKAVGFSSPIEKRGNNHIHTKLPHTHYTVQNVKNSSKFYELLPYDKSHLVCAETGFGVIIALWYCLTVIQWDV